MKLRCSKYAFLWGFTLLITIIPGMYSLQAQETADSSRVEERPEDWDKGELIELDAVQIKGEIAQPNVTITVTRQNPVFKELTLEPTPSESLIDFDIILEGMEVFQPVKIRNWKEILERPRE